VKRRGTTPVVCSIGSTDPTAGAGLFLDAAVYARLGVSAAFVVAGVTAQNSAGVLAVRGLPPREVIAQLEAVRKQVRPDVIRIGLLPSTPAMLAVARYFDSMRRRPTIVLDPVIVSTSGHRFAKPGAIPALRMLLGVATIATPNAREAAELAGFPVRTVDDAERAAKVLAAYGCAVLVTGGHLQSEDFVVDILASGARITRYSARRLPQDSRGTGCMLAAAIAASLAQGASLDRAVPRARAFVRAAIVSARPLGNGRPQFATRKT
jgi:hydroxymethylpyrimidine/phosphomethylpyrimidine kinase